MYTEQIIELIERYGAEMQPGNQFFYRALLSNNQIIGAIKTFAKGVNPDAIIGMVDDSLKKDGTEGIMFTTSSIYFSNVDIQGMSIKNAMVRYRDISNVKIITNKISDYSNVVQVDICNLPYENYRVSNVTFKKKPFESLIAALVDMQKQDDVFEKDDRASYSVVRHYLYQKDKIMRGVLDKIHSKDKIDTSLVRVTDAFGLTPLHYCIAFGDIDNAYRILKETLKYNKDMYVCRQPFGIYSYCMSVVMSGYDLHSDMGELFEDVFRVTDEMRLLKKQFVKEKIIEGGQAFVEWSINQIMEINEQEKQMRSEAIAEAVQEIAHEKDKLEKIVVNENNYLAYMARKENIKKAEEIVQRKKEEWGLVEETIEEDQYSFAYDEYDDYIDFSEESSGSCDDMYLSASMAIYKEMKDLVKTHFNECKNTFLEIKRKSDEGVYMDEPRTPVILNMFEDGCSIERRLEAISCENEILRIKAKYFMVPKRFLEIYPHLIDFIAVF